MRVRHPMSYGSEKKHQRDTSKSLGVGATSRGWNKILASSMIEWMKIYFLVTQQKTRLTNVRTKDSEKLLRVSMLRLIK